MPLALPTDRRNAQRAPGTGSASAHTADNGLLVPVIGGMGIFDSVEEECDSADFSIPVLSSLAHCGGCEVLKPLPGDSSDSETAIFDSDVLEALLLLNDESMECKNGSKSTTIVKPSWISSNSESFDDAKFKDFTANQLNCQSTSPIPKRCREI